MSGKDEGSRQTVGPPWSPAGMRQPLGIESVERMTIFQPGVEDVRSPGAPPLEGTLNCLHGLARCAAIIGSWCGTSLGSVLLLALSGCAPVSRDIPRTPGLLLEDAFSMTSANGKALSGESGRLRRFSLVRAGVRRDGLLLVAPTVVSAPIPGLAGKMEFRCFVAPVYNIGDGVVLEVVLHEADTERTLLRRRLDAGRRAEDRRWIELVAPFQISQDGASLLLRASGGEPEYNAGTGVDLVADWLVVADPRLTTERSEK